MIPSLIIVFREVLEAALIVGIILSYLVRIKQTKFNTVVYYGVGSGIVASIIGAFLFNALADGFSGRAEELFEGIAMLVGALLLTTMILWMKKQKHIASALEHKVAAEITEAHRFGLFFLVFIAVLREGIETVIFLGASSFVSQDNNLFGALIGMIAAVILGYILFVGGKKMNIKKFFTVTGIILIFFAAGLVAHGVHEFQEATVIPVINEHVWDINPSLAADGSYPLMHEKGYIGSIAKGLLGYNGDPSLLEVGSYIVYLILVTLLWKRKERVPDTLEGG